MVKLYTYRITMTKKDGIKVSKVYQNKKEIETELGISISTINNIIAGKSVNKYNYIEIEKIPEINLEERRKEKVKGYLKTYYKKKNLEKINSESVKEKVYKDLEEKFCK